MEDRFVYTQFNIVHPILKGITKVTWNEPGEELMMGFCYSYMVYNEGGGEITFHDGKKCRLPKVHIHPPRSGYLTLKKNKGSSIYILVLHPTFFYKATGIDLGNEVKYFYDVPASLQNAIELKMNPNIISSLDLKVIGNNFLSVIDLLTFPVIPIDDIINCILASNGHFDLANYLKKSEISRSTIHRHFKKMIGMSPGEYIRLAKFNLVVHNLINQTRTVGQVIEQFAYHDFSHLNKDFKSFSGITAGNYRDHSYRLLHEVLKEFAQILRSDPISN